MNFLKLITFKLHGKYSSFVLKPVPLLFFIAAEQKDEKLTEAENQDRTSCPDNAELQPVLGQDNNLTSNKPLSDSQSSLRSIADNDSSATMSADESSHQDPGALPISTPAASISRTDTPTLITERPMSSNMVPVSVSYSLPVVQHQEQNLLKEPRPASEGVDLSHSRGFSPFRFSSQQSPHRPASAVSEPGRSVSSPRPKSAGPASVEKIFPGSSSYISIHSDQEQLVFREGGNVGVTNTNLAANCNQQDTKKQKTACVRDLIHSAIERNLSRGENSGDTISSM